MYILIDELNTDNVIQYEICNMYGRTCSADNKYREFRVVCMTDNNYIIVADELTYDDCKLLLNEIIYSIIKDVKIAHVDSLLSNSRSHPKVI